MPRVHHVKKARKDNPAVKKGESYYWWKFAYAPKRYSKTYPKASQLTQSDKLSRLYEAEESVAAVDVLGSIDGIVDVLQEASDQVREIGEEYQESADNIREYFEDSPIAEECEEKSYACEATAGSIEEVISSLHDYINTTYEDNAGEVSDKVSSILNDISWEMA